MSPQLTDADIARHDATAGKVLTDADIAALDNHPPAPGIGQQLLDVGVNTAKDVGAGIYGASATANKVFANLAMMGGNVLKNTAGIEASAPLLNLESYFRRSQEAQQQEAQRLAGGRNDLASQINRGLTQGVLETPQYLVAGHLAGPVAGMAAIGGISEADQGWLPALKAAAEGALTGGALHVMGPASQAIRLTGAAAMTYAQARLNGADNETALAHATTMGLMAGHTPGGVTAREFVPGLDTAIETAGRVAEATGAGMRAAAPDVGRGTLKAGVGYLAGEAAGMIPGGGFARHMLDIPTALVGARQIGRGLQKGYQAARTAYGESAPPEAPVAAEPGPGPAGAPTDDAVLHLYSVETDPAKRAALRTELIDRGLMNDPNAPAAPGDNPYRGYTQTALRNVYGIEPDPAKRALIEQAAQSRGLSLLNREGRRATAAPPETGAEERGPSLTQDDVLLLRYLGEENPLNADAETIGIARQLAAEKPDLLPRLRSGAPEPTVAPVTPAEAAAPPVTSLGTLEYNAPAAAQPPAEAPAPAAPVPGKGNPAEIAAQLEASSRPDRMLDFLRRVDPAISANALDSIAPHEWEMVAHGAGSPKGTVPTAEDIAAIRSNLRKPPDEPPPPPPPPPAPAPAAPEVTLPAGTTPAQALADLMGPQAPLPGEGTPAPTASEIRVEGIAKHLAEDKGINVDDLATVAEKPAALAQLDKLREALGIDGAVIGHELPKIIDRVRQLRGEPTPPRGHVQKFDPSTLKFTESGQDTGPYVGDSSSPILAYEEDGQYHVIDGHHRVQQAIKSGTSVDAVVMPADVFREFQRQGIHQAEMKLAYARKLRAEGKLDR
jgi:hypothetical protein